MDEGVTAGLMRAGTRLEINDMVWAALMTGVAFAELLFEFKWVGGDVGNGGS